MTAAFSHMCSRGGCSRRLSRSGSQARKIATKTRDTSSKAMFDMCEPSPAHPQAKGRALCLQTPAAQQYHIAIIPHIGAQDGARACWSRKASPSPYVVLAPRTQASVATICTGEVLSTLGAETDVLHHTRERNARFNAP